MLLVLAQHCGELGGPVKADTKDALREQFKASVLLPEWLAEEVASPALFLASNESSYTTFIDLRVDGGLRSV
jgi:NAD(P)-dependent dehydrogenase (short-subunit alcohol dehydrogenase family)